MLSPQVVLMSDEVLGQGKSQMSSVLEPARQELTQFGGGGGGSSLSPFEVSDSNDDATKPDHQITQPFKKELKFNDAHENKERKDQEVDANPITEHTADIIDAKTPDTDCALNKPQWNTNASNYPVPKKNSDGTPLLKMNIEEEKLRELDRDDNRKGPNAKYDIPAISSSLDSFRQTWEKIESSNSTKIQNANNDECTLHDEFRIAISTNQVDIKIDTSITGKYTKKNYVPIGFEPSTEEACKKEQYKVIKLSETTEAEDEDQTTQDVISPLSYYQSWDPVTMRYEPKLKGSEDKVELTRAFPLGAAAAGTRAALLSFMGTRASLMEPLEGIDSIPTEQQPHPLLNASNADIIGIDPENDASTDQSSLQPPSVAKSVPEKIIIQPQVAESQRVVSGNYEGGKKIEHLKDDMTTDAEKIASKRKRGYEDDKSFTDSSSKQTVQTLNTDDAVCDGSLRRGKRHKKNRTYYDD